MLDEYNKSFWEAIDILVNQSKIVIDRPKGSRHPKYPDIVYPVDYGYLKNTSSPDGNEIDVWKGSASSQDIDGIICTVPDEERLGDKASYRLHAGRKSIDIHFSQRKRVYERDPYRKKKGIINRLPQLLLR